MKTSYLLPVLVIALSLGLPLVANARESSEPRQAEKVSLETTLALKECTGFIVAPVVLGTGAEVHMKAVSAENRALCAQFLGDEHKRVLGAQGKLLTEAAPGVVRVELTLLEIKGAKPVGSTVTHILPIGAVLNLGRRSKGKEAPCSGSITYECRLLDSVSGAILSVYSVHSAPVATDLINALSTKATIAKSVTKAAEDFAQLVHNNQAEVQPVRS